MIRQIKFISIPVTNQDRALEFYRDKLGFEVVTDASFGEGARWIEVRPVGTETHLVLFPPSDDTPISTPAMVFASDDVHTTFSELAARGVKFTKEPYEDEDSGGYFASFEDPDKNEFLIASSK